MTFTTNQEALLVFDRPQLVTYVLETQVGKICTTPTKALEGLDHKTIVAFSVINFTNSKSRDVTEDMAKAYIAKYEPEADEDVPPFVENSYAWTVYLEEMGRPVNVLRQYSTLNHEQTGVRS